MQSPRGGAKYADALRRISFARRSSRFSRSSALSRSPSALVSPGRTPSSRSAWRTHLRSVSAEQPIFDDTEPMAAHCDSCAPWWSRTNRTARSRSSGEYLFECFMAPVSRGLEPPGNPGQFSAQRCYPGLSRPVPCLVQSAHAALGTAQGDQCSRVPDRTAGPRLAHAARLSTLADTALIHGRCRVLALLDTPRPRALRASGQAQLVCVKMNHRILIGAVFGYECSSFYTSIS